ncbi:MAG: TetR/AcrR family transcriptional regulator [Pseudonocardia sp.]
MSAHGARARVRAELTREITDAARRHLAAEGAAGLSLRAVARELGMASSAVYRYFPSRDDLLTRLIIEAYDALGEAAERAEGRVDRADLRGRLRATCSAARTWALAHPHEYALVYGSPVPGYAAPEATIGPAGRVGLLLCRIVADALPAAPAAGTGAGQAAGGDAVPAATPAGTGPAGLLAPGLAARMGLPEGTDAAERAILVWVSLFGLIGFELFGHTNNVVVAHEEFMNRAVRRWADELGLP